MARKDLALAEHIHDFTHCSWGVGGQLTLQLLEVGDILILIVGVELDTVQSQITENAVEDNTKSSTKQL